MDPGGWAFSAMEHSPPPALPPEVRLALSLLLFQKSLKTWIYHQAWGGEGVPGYQKCSSMTPLWLIVLLSLTGLYILIFEYILHFIA